VPSSTNNSPSQKRTRGLDDIDKNLIRLLYSDSQMKYAEIADKIGVSVGSVHNRIKALKQKGYIQKFTIQPNSELLGYDLSAIIQMQIEVSRLSEINEQLQKIDQITTIYNNTGEFDIFLIGRFKNRHQLNDVLQNILKIPGVQRTNTHLILQVLKEEWISDITLKGK
jgi:DNA-binding Lrp family transcriptional regulator